LFTDPQFVKYFHRWMWNKRNL